MNTKPDAARNSPCPCGSGKKYKKCHGAAPVPPATENHFDISRKIAYKGAIGRARQEFCEKFIERKQPAFEAISMRQTEIAGSANETISCRQGCNYCCFQYVDASLQESEAVVYYLYRHEDILANFLKTYPEWREQVRLGGDSFQNIRHTWGKIDGKWHDKKTIEGGLAGMFAYTMADVPCPFLVDSSCSIYPVRPYSCAGVFATTPPEQCKASNRNKSNMRTALDPDIVNDVAFYYGGLVQPVQSLLPLTVFRLLNDGLIGLPEIPGIENLPRDYMNDPEVRGEVEKYLNQTKNL